MSRAIVLDSSVILMEYFQATTSNMSTDLTVLSGPSTMLGRTKVFDVSDRKRKISYFTLFDVVIEKANLIK